MAGIVAGLNMMKLRYIRKGKCNRCGQCCVNEDCEYLKWEKDRTTTCLIFSEKDRPLKCKWFPQSPPIIFENCGYYFLDTWENNRVVGVKEI